jgi:hypothetical protein
LENEKEKMREKMEKFDTVSMDICSLVGSGSGGVAVVSIDGRDQCGSNGVN